MARTLVPDERAHSLFYGWWESWKKFEQEQGVWR